MCRWCDLDNPDSTLTPEQVAKQKRVLQMLTLVEHPDALPARDAMRLGQEILALLDELDDACPDWRLARPGLPRQRGARPPLAEFH